ncbi:class I SAM-dependent methyltransferase [Patescibacteria group bacterium]|nr:class I SAM-dependent methyltransferase [Patescibacteria group bacterium]
MNIKKYHEDFSKSISTHLWGQSPDEIVSAMQFIVQHFSSKESVRFLEIGSRTGQNFVFMGNTLAKSGKQTYGLSLDLPNIIEWGGGNIDTGKCIQDLPTLFEYDVMVGNSHNAEVLEMAKAKGPFDFLFIDGDHSETGCQQDFDNYKTIVSNGGLIAFHDIIYYPKWPHVKVSEVWKNLKQKYVSHEFSVLNRYGIGIIEL